MKKNLQSMDKQVTFCIPQGSVLGPILFVIFINVLSGVVDSAAYPFSDDSKIYRKQKSKADTTTL